VLQSVATIVAHSVEHLRLERERTQALQRERTARAELEALYKASTVLTAELDLQRILQCVTDSGREMTGADFGAFFYNPAEDKLAYTVSGAPREAFETIADPRATALLGPILRGEAVMRVDDVRTDPRYSKRGPFHGLPEGHLAVVSCLAVPVVHSEGEVLGGLFLGHRSAGVFTSTHERMAKALARHAAVAIGKARLLENLASGTVVNRAVQAEE